MIQYIAKRLVQLIAVLFGVTFLTFMITQAAPSDAAQMQYISMGTIPSEELLEQTREEMGLMIRCLFSMGAGCGMSFTEIWERPQNSASPF